MQRFEYRDRIQELNVDAAALASALEREIEGEVRFDDGSRALYATDASNYRQVPIGVVLPRSADDVIAELEGPFTLVTSDRGLRERVGKKAERFIGGGSFLREIAAVPK